MLRVHHRRTFEQLLSLNFNSNDVKVYYENRNQLEFVKLEEIQLA